MPAPEQPMLFNEPEICQETTESENDIEAIRIDVKSYQRKAKRTKKELTEGLPQKDIIYELPEEALTDEEGNHYEYVTTNLVRNEVLIIPKQILSITSTAIFKKHIDCLLIVGIDQRDLFTGTLKTFSISPVFRLQVFNRTVRLVRTRFDHHAVF